MNDWFLDALVRQHGADSQHVKVWLYQKEMVSRFVREAVRLENCLEEVVELLTRDECATALTVAKDGLDELMKVRKSYYQGVSK